MRNAKTTSRHRRRGLRRICRRESVGLLHLRGLVAWLLWLVIPIYYLIDFRNRFVVMFQCAWSYFTFKRGARLPPTLFKKWDGVVFKILNTG